jgi:hypothetical protein
MLSEFRQAAMLTNKEPWCSKLFGSLGEGLVEQKGRNREIVGPEEPLFIGAIIAIIDMPPELWVRSPPITEEGKRCTRECGRERR